MDRISTGGELTNELGSSSVDEGNNGVVPRPARHGIGPVASSRRSSHTNRDATMFFGVAAPHQGIQHGGEASVGV